MLVDFLIDIQVIPIVFVVDFKVVVIIWNKKTKKTKQVLCPTLGLAMDISECRLQQPQQMEIRTTS